MSPAGDEETFKLFTRLCGFMWIISLTILSVVKVLITVVINADKVASCLHPEFLSKRMFEHQFSPPRRPEEAQFHTVSLSLLGIQCAGGQRNPHQTEDST